MAPTREERHEVAERLRGLDSAITSHDTLEQSVDKLLKATYGERPFSPIRYSVRNLCGLGYVLADLIDQTCTVESSIFDDTCECESPAWGYRLSCGHWLDWGDSEPPSYCPYCGCRITCGHSFQRPYNEPPAYCTECGARVVSGDGD